MRKWLILVMLMTGISAGVLLAQEATPDPTPAPTDCTPDALAETQATLSRTLADFEAMVTAEDDTERLAALETLFTVGEAYQQIAFDCGYVPDDINDRTVGTDIVRILEIIADLRGDSINGQLLYTGQSFGADGLELGCSTCHNAEEIAPLTESTWTRWDEIRTLEPELEAMSFEEYIVRSILLPGDYVVPEYNNVMPPNYGDRMTFQNLADLIRYLESQDQFLD